MKRKSQVPTATDTESFATVGDAVGKKLRQLESEVKFAARGQSERSVNPSESVKRWFEEHLRPWGRKQLARVSTRIRNLGDRAFESS